ncbi:hypothetical protein K504DRAFT_125218 [Pleomassaria siparia CBS 279.74]|uniref:Ubiquitin-like protease family profile domain-containing protein n=1 Tax=Pleomassaria siparia CBS 279.74 TaxID=1314801 RepID=A0A6G1KKN9_9PLEO|nr:hypothetical protein K504DRAFT_125218 [Pleomassaria siparia CBS 279.74]
MSTPYRPNGPTHLRQEIVNLLAQPRHLLTHPQGNMLVVADRTHDNFETTKWGPDKSLQRRRYTIDVNTDVKWPIDRFPPHMTEAEIKDKFAREARWEKLTKENRHPEISPPGIIQKGKGKGKGKGSVLLPTPNDKKELDRPSFYNPDKNFHEYVEFPNSMIQNNEMLEINNYGSWYYDNTIAVGVDIIKNLTGCEKHGIAVMQPFMARNLAILGNSAAEDVDFRHYRTEVQMITAKNFVFIPVNDAYLQYEQTGNSAGSHWALVVVDCRDSDVSMKARYYDSLGRYGNMMEIAKMCAQGVFEIIRASSARFASRKGPDNNMNFEFEADGNTPNQNKDNVSTGDRGACGPFMLGLIKELVLSIVDHVEDYGPLSMDKIDLKLPPGFGNDFGFNSQKARWVLTSLIAREKRIQDLKPLGKVLRKKSVEPWYSAANHPCRTDTALEASCAYMRSRIHTLNVEKGAPAVPAVEDEDIDMEGIL